MKELVSVLIPVLNPGISVFEERLLDHCLSTLSKYPIVLIVSEEWDTTVLKERYPVADVVTFKEKYFKSRQTLSNLFLIEDFYNQFSWSEFLLIHELNSWVTKDELYYWCKQGYDYVHAEPVPEKATLKDLPGSLSRITGLTDANKEAAGQLYRDNGLFLCRVERMARSLRSKKKEAHDYRQQSALPNKDALFWNFEVNRFWPHLRKPTRIVQNRFCRDIAGGIPPGIGDRELWPFALTGITENNIVDLPHFL